MEGKRRAAAAVAAVAVAVAVGCSAARCAAGGDGDGVAQGEGEVQVEQTAEQRALAALTSRSWAAEGDGSKTVEFRDGSFVEADGSGVRVTAFDVAGASEGDDWCALTVRLVRDGEPGTETEIVVEGREGSLRVSCDGFAGPRSYVESAGAGAGVAVEGLDPGYLELAGVDAGALEAAVSSYCGGRVPSARAASFDGEVYWDVGAGRVTATFHCDDAARTILTVTCAGGAVTVAG